WKAVTLRQGRQTFSSLDLVARSDGAGTFVMASHLASGVADRITSGSHSDHPDRVVAGTTDYASGGGRGVDDVCGFAYPSGGRHDRIAFRYFCVACFSAVLSGLASDHHCCCSRGSSSFVVQLSAGVELWPHLFYTPRS